MNHKELVEMARISFGLPEEPYANIRDVLVKADERYGKDTRVYREGLEVLLTQYVEPQVKGPVSVFGPMTEEQKAEWG